MQMGTLKRRSAGLGAGRCDGPYARAALGKCNAMSDKTASGHSQRVQMFKYHRSRDNVTQQDPPRERTYEDRGFVSV